MRFDRNLKKLFDMGTGTRCTDPIYRAHPTWCSRGTGQQYSCTAVFGTNTSPAAKLDSRRQTEHFGKISSPETSSETSETSPPYDNWDGRCASFGSAR